MMSDQYRREISQLIEDAASLRAAIIEEGSAAAEARAEATKQLEEAQSATSKLTRETALRAVANANRKAVAADRRICELQRALGANLNRQHSKKRYLQFALRNEQSLVDRAAGQHDQNKASDARSCADTSPDLLIRDAAKIPGRHTE
jgi:hypothetical protein